MTLEDIQDATHSFEFRYMQVRHSTAFGGVQRATVTVDIDWLGLRSALKRGHLVEIDTMLGGSRWSIRGESNPAFDKPEPLLRHVLERAAARDAAERLKGYG